MSKLISLIILSIVLLIVTVLFSVALYTLFTYFKFSIKRSKDYKKLDKKRSEMIANGEAHDWMEMNILGEKRTVCKKTGWCPSVEAYVDPKVIKGFLESKMLEEEHKAKSIDMIKEIAKEVGMSVETIMDIKERLIRRETDAVVELIKNRIDK